MKKHKNYILATRQWKSWRFKNTFLLILSLIAFIYLVETPIISKIMNDLGSLGYLGAFIAGIFFVSTFTVAPASVVLFNIANTLSPIEVSLLAGVGAMLGDYVIFKYVKDKVFHEILPVIKKLHNPKLKLLFKSPYFAWVFPVIGAILIASPLPDEVGVSMMGISKINKWKFLLITFFLNSTGILLIVSVSQAY